MQTLCTALQNALQAQRPWQPVADRLATLHMARSWQLCGTTPAGTLPSPPPPPPPARAGPAAPTAARRDPKAVAPPVAVGASVEPGHDDDNGGPPSPAGPALVTWETTCRWLTWVGQQPGLVLRSGPAEWLEAFRVRGPPPGADDNDCPPENPNLERTPLPRAGPRHVPRQGLLTMAWKPLAGPPCVGSPSSHSSSHSSSPRVPSWGQGRGNFPAAPPFCVPDGRGQGRGVRDGPAAPRRWAGPRTVVAPPTA